MKTISVVAVHKIVVVTLVIITAISSSLTVSSFPKNSTTTKSLINCVCKSEKVQYPGLCYSMFTPFSRKAKNQISRLTQIAVRVSLTYSRDLITNVSNIKSNSSTVKSAVKDCKDSIVDARDSVQQSVDQMKKLSGGGLDLKLNNVQTWMSAAMTSVGDCVDETSSYGKDADSEEGDAQTFEVVVNGTETLNMVISNSLAVVNIYAESVAGTNKTCG